MLKLGRPRAAIPLCLLVLACPPEGARAQSSASVGEELYTDYFGCWNCHGQRGEGGEGQPLRETYLPLSLFIKALRLPAGEMPPFSDILATDVELATVYVWLEGADAVAVPPPVTFEVEPSVDVEAGAEIELAFTARPTDPPDAGEAPSFRYRLTLSARDNTLVASRPFQQREHGAERWSTAETDPYGQALLGPREGVALASSAGPGEATTRLRLTLPAGEYVLVIEAVDIEDALDPAIFGVGTVVLTVE